MQLYMLAQGQREGYQEPEGMGNRVLYFVHGHPALRAGGAEQASLELYEAVRDGGEFEPFLAARTDDLAFARP